MSAPGPAKALKVGNYLLELESIGKGSSGEVRKGIQCATGEKVAVKVMEKAWILRNRCGPAVAREVSLMAKLSHPNVVRLLEVMNSRTHVYVVMEMVAGKELYDEIVQRGCLPEAEAGGYFAQLIRGLIYIHAMGVSHRDIKPENLLVRKDGSLVIIDFGLSASLDLDIEPMPPARPNSPLRAEMERERDGNGGCSPGASPGSAPVMSPAGSIGSWGSSRSHSRSPGGGRGHRRLRTVCGTPYYTAPEVFRANGSGRGYDGKCADVWSAGVVLYAMLAGRLPFEGQDVPETLRFIEKSRLKFPDSVPESARPLLTAMLNKDPLRRPSLQEVAVHPWVLSHQRESTIIKEDELRMPTLVTPTTCEFADAAAEPLAGGDIATAIAAAMMPPARAAATAAVAAAVEMPGGGGGGSSGGIGSLTPSGESRRRVQWAPPVVAAA